MLQKLKLGSIFSALILFLFPWVEIQCSEKTMATQSGLQVIYGGGTPSEGMEAFSGESGSASPVREAKSKSPTTDSRESMGYAPLVALALGVIIVAFGFSFMAVFRRDPVADRLASVLPAVALGLLLIQLMVGFPASKQMRQAVSEAATESKQDSGGMDGLGSSMTAAMMMNMRIQTKPAFYLELLALGLPTLILLNAFIDKHRKSDSL
jgi:hypothetical protein